VRQGIIVAVAALDSVGAKVIFPLAPHAVPEDAEFVAVSTSLSRTVGLSAPEASRADEPLGAVRRPRCRLSADGCSVAMACCWGVGWSKVAVLALAVRVDRLRSRNSPGTALRRSRSSACHRQSPQAAGQIAHAIAS